MSIKWNDSRKQIVYTIATIFLLCAVITAMISYIYMFSEQEGYEKLHLETQQIKKDIYLQIHSDRENLVTIANFASKLYSDGDSFDLLFQSYKEIGLIKNIGILLPDNKFVTKVGAMDVGTILVFEEEAEKGEYVSGRVKDITNPDREVIRSAVPVQVDGATVAMLYGVIELDTLEEKYEEDVKALDAELFVLEGKTGNMLVDTKHENLGNITELATRTYKKEYSYDAMFADLSTDTSGYSAFVSEKTGKMTYVHYAPVQIGDWQIMLSKEESVVFAGARSTGRFLIIMFSIVVFIMMMYLVAAITSTNRNAKIGVYASVVRKKLLAVNRQIDSIQDALKDITHFAKARSTFFVDTYGEDYSFIIPSKEAELLKGEDRAYFIQKLMRYISQHRIERGISVQTIKLIANRKLYYEMPEFHSFLKKHKIRSVQFAGVIDNKNSLSLIGVVNPQCTFVENFLKDIAICFSMAIYSKKHLENMESMAFKDSLTGLKNRMAYKQDVKDLGMVDSESITCIFFDVDNLRFFNNNYGHAAGDQMLVFIAEVLTKEFSDSRVYRMGGDEFLIITENISEEIIEERLALAKEEIEEMKYHISMGIKHGEKDMDIDEMVNIADKAMYGEKARYHKTH